MTRPDSKSYGAVSAGAAAPAAGGTFVSPSVRAWKSVMADEELRADIELGLDQAQRGETKPWGEIRQRIR